LDWGRLRGMGVDHIISPSRTGLFLLDKKNVNFGMQAFSGDFLSVLLELI